MKSNKRTKCWAKFHLLLMNSDTTGLLNSPKRECRDSEDKMTANKSHYNVLEKT